MTDGDGSTYCVIVETPMGRIPGRYNDKNAHYSLGGKHLDESKNFWIVYKK